MGVLQVRVLDLATIATRNFHFSELGVRGYPRILHFFAGGSPKILFWGFLRRGLAVAGYFQLQLRREVAPGGR